MIRNNRDKKNEKIGTKRPKQLRQPEMAEIIGIFVTEINGSFAFFARALGVFCGNNADLQELS